MRGCACPPDMNTVRSSGRLVLKNVELEQRSGHRLLFLLAPTKRLQQFHLE